jgi:HK97 family phage portal protein
VQRFTNSVYRNGVFPSGVIKAAGKLGPDAVGQLGRMFREAFGGSNKAAKALILDQGLEWAQLSGLSAEDAELVAARRFTVEEICRIFGTPPPIVQDYSHNTFTNSEAAGRWFAQFTIGPWCRKIEAEFARSVLASGYELELDLSGFMRGDPETRWKSHEIAVKNRILTPNEVREVEGWNPRPDGDGFSQEATGNA